MSREPPHPGPPLPPSGGQHLTTLSHEGRFWDVYLEFTDDSDSQGTWRALLCFSPADRGEREELLRTTTIILEPTYEEALARAQSLEDHHLVGLLRSCLPD